MIDKWVNLCPAKLIWELHQLDSIRYSQQPWWDQLDTLSRSLATLATYDLTGIKLNIFNYELLTEDLTFIPQRLDSILTLTAKHGLRVDLTAGPLQFPLWPGLRLPPVLHPASSNYSLLEKFGQFYLQQLLNIFGDDPRINNFYIGNEWPNTQHWEHIPKLAHQISVQTQVDYVITAQKYTTKPLIVNTNYPVHKPATIEYVYLPLIRAAKNFQLGLDVYPSRISWRGTPLEKIALTSTGFPNLFSQLKNKLNLPVLFSEFEAQPWGSGQSWAEYLSQPSDNFDQPTLQKWLTNYIVPLQSVKVTFWGGEYWLVAHQSGQSWIQDLMINL